MATENNASHDMTYTTINDLRQSDAPLFFFSFRRWTFLRILDAAHHSWLGRLLFRDTQAPGWSPEPYIGFPSEPSLAKERLGFSPTIAAAFFLRFFVFARSFRRSTLTPGQYRTS